MPWYIKGTKSGVSLYYAGENIVATAGQRKDKWCCAGHENESQKVAFSSQSEAQAKLDTIDVDDTPKVVEE